MSRPRALRDSPRCVVFSAVRGLRFGWSPIRCRASAFTLRSEPRFPSPRTLRGSRSSPCADAMSRPRALRDSPRCVVFSAVRGLRFGWSPIRCRASASTLRSEPRLPSPRTLRGFRSSRLLRPPLSSPAGWASALCRRRPPPPHTLSPPLPDGVTSSEPRSVRADGIPGSERYAATATR